MNSSFLSFPAYFSLFGIYCRKLLVAVLYPQMGGEGLRQILGLDIRMSYGAGGGLFQVQVVVRDRKEKVAAL